MHRTEAAEVDLVWQIEDVRRLLQIGTKPGHPGDKNRITMAIDHKKIEVSPGGPSVLCRGEGLFVTCIRRPLVSGRREVARLDNHQEPGLKYQKCAFIGQKRALNVDPLGLYFGFDSCATLHTWFCEKSFWRKIPVTLELRKRYRFRRLCDEQWNWRATSPCSVVLFALVLRKLKPSQNWEDRP